MRRTVSETKIGTTQNRYKVRIEDDPSGPGWDAGTRLVNFMAALVANPELINCGYSKPQQLRFYHSGAGWVAEGEAVLDVEA